MVTVRQTDPAGRRRLIVNADDFGLAPTVSRGVIAAHERGILTSASLMVRHGRNAEEAVAMARAYPRLGLGLHVDLGEQEFVGGAWRVRYEVVPPDDAAAVAAEVNAQLDRFRQLVGRDPTHVDSHQHVHRDGPARGVCVEVARRLGVPLRGLSERVRHCGAFYGQDGAGRAYPELITADALVRLIEDLPAGATEISCHPADGAGTDSVYARERVLELAALCDPRVRAAVEAGGIECCSFADVRER